MEKLLKLKAAYSSIDGYKISQEVKKTLKNEKRYGELEGITYGEIDVDEFSKLLQDIKKVKTGLINSFYDIGSGTGKPVLVASCVFPDLLVAVGIEIVENLHKCAQEALGRSRVFLPRSCKVSFICGDSFALTENKAIKLCSRVNDDESSSPHKRKSFVENEDNIEITTSKKIKSSVQVVNSNVDNWAEQQQIQHVKSETEPFNWYNGDVIFMPTTCFTDQMMDKVDESIKRIKRGSIVITTTRRLDNKLAKLKFSRRCKYGKGSLLFFIWEIMYT